jgi:RNA polymerase sigma-70 factor (ECF subfamily)
MSNEIDTKTLKALQQGSHKAFEEVFITYYGKTKAFIYGYIKSGAYRRFICESLDKPSFY